MIANVEKEYDSFLRKVWQQFSHETLSPVESQQELRYIYDTVSLASNKFLQDRLKSLEEEKG